MITAAVSNKSTTTKRGYFEGIINRYRARGLTKVADYLSDKARKSARTALAYSFALDHLNKFIEQNSN
jgi:hypothetical protein